MGGVFGKVFYGGRNIEGKGEVHSANGDALLFNS